MKSENVVTMPRLRHYNLVNRGIDYFVATMQSTHSDYIEKKANGYRLLEDKQKEGNKLQSHKRLGYEGYSVNNSFVGENENGVLFWFTGEYGEIAYNALYDPYIHVSRIDPQITLAVKRGNDTLALRMRSIWKELKRKKKIHSRIRGQYIDGLGNGDTFYIGSLSSDCRIRVYDKGLESKVTEGNKVWRIEAQLRNDYANNASNYIYTGEDRSECITGLLSPYIQKYCIPIKYTDSEATHSIHIPKDKSDIERKLNWLSVSVRPTVMELLKYGYYEVLQSILGFDCDIGGIDDYRI